jgi:hypothetical protein
MLMAKAEPNERTEREFQLDVNQAVANTEDEIFTDAMDDKELDNDGDTSLEQMGEGLEGDDLEETETEEEGDAESEESEEGDKETAEGTETEDADSRDQARDERSRDNGQQDRRGVPPGRLREEAQARRAAEEREAAKDRQLAELTGRFNELSARVNAPPRPVTTEQKSEKPDMFADPEKYEAWLMAEAEKKAEAKLEQRFGAYEQRQQQERENQLNENLAQTANGERGFEFQAAYRALTSLDPKDPANRATVQRLIKAPDQGKAILDWFEENGADDFRASIAKQLGLVPSQRDQQRGNGQQRPTSRQQSQQPRHETRLPPSLNTTQGGGRQEVRDPEMMDDTDDSVFRYAARR